LEYRDVLYGPHYATWGVPAALTLEAGVFPDMTAIDLTSGVAVPGTIEIESLGPGALMLVGDLADQGITLDDLDTGQIALNGRAWMILSHRPEPSPNGIADGQVLLQLEAAA
jgi:hypothetical protein